MNTLPKLIVLRVDPRDSGEVLLKTIQDALHFHKDFYMPSYYHAVNNARVVDLEAEVRAVEAQSCSDEASAAGYLAVLRRIAGGGA